MTMTADVRGMTAGVPEPGFYSDAQLDEVTSLSRVTRWRMIRAGQFPAPVQLSPGRVGTEKRAVHKWIADRLAQATNKAANTGEAA